MEDPRFSISGLRWSENWRIPNGNDSFVVPFATLRPATLVFHGEEPFSYGHYGIHLGQADVLTFLGPSDQVIHGHFVDCRAESPTRHVRETAEWSPDSSRALVIPPGVAHAFEGLEDVYTLNTYELYLPNPTEWLGGETDWNVESDVINIPMDVTHAELPSLHANPYRAGELWYQLVADQQRAAIPDFDFEYPLTKDVTLANGESVRIALHRPRSEESRRPDWEAISGIEGLGWSAHLVLWSGANSGFVPLLDARPLYFIDHGEDHYAHDAYGIHLGQEDHLTFVGPFDQEVSLHLMDCRRDSRTYSNEVEVRFRPDPLRYLKIPNGVAHRFEGLERVFTINRAHVFLPVAGDYEPGNDVIDWPFDQRPAPALEAYPRPAGDDFYRMQVASQKELMREPPRHSTPTVLLANDSDGSPVRVALRRRN